MGHPFTQPTISPTSRATNYYYSFIFLARREAPRPSRRSYHFARRGDDIHGQQPARGRCREGYPLITVGALDECFTGRGTTPELQALADSVGPIPDSAPTPSRT